MGFDAASIRQHDLAYDFTTYPGADGQPWAISGIVPEPTAQVRDTFLSAVTAAYTLEGDSEEQLAAAFAKLPADRKAQSLSQLREAMIGLCSGSPDGDVLNALPFDLFDAFQRWLMGELFAPPTPPTAASSASQAIEGTVASSTRSDAISA
jgi:hypothetical protein